MLRPEMNLKECPGQLCANSVDGNQTQSSLPSSKKAENVEDQVQNMRENLLVDPEIHSMLRQNLLENEMAVAN